jgi:PAS domain-containing protein/two-component sensor histidine kinase
MLWLFGIFAEITCREYGRNFGVDPLTWLFQTDGFPARWDCGPAWQESPWLGWLHIIADLGVWSAYLAIPVVLWYFVKRRKDLPFRKVFLLFGAFIFACGTTHLMEAIIFWWPGYRLAGMIKLFTALVSWATVFALIRVVPGVLTMRAPEELEKEIAARKAAEAELQKVNAELERRVGERTVDLTAAVTALQASDHREKQRAIELESVLRVTPTPIWISHDPQCRKITGNPASYRLIGMDESSNVSATSEAPLERSFTEYRNGVPLSSEELPLQISASKGIEIYDAEITFVFNDGRERHIFGNSAPIRDSDGSVRGAVGAFVDITSMKKAEQSLKEADRRKDEFLATLAHELRNPLAPIRNSLEVLKLADGDSSLIDASRETMERQMAQMVRLIDDLLDVSRITRNKLDLRCARVELASIVHHAIETCRPLIDAAGLDFELTLPATPIYLNADTIRLTQVFSNLLTNATKYTERGGKIRFVVEQRSSPSPTRVSGFRPICCRGCLKCLRRSNARVRWRRAGSASDSPSSNGWSRCIRGRSPRIVQAKARARNSPYGCRFLAKARRPCST